MIFNIYIHFHISLDTCSPSTRETFWQLVSDNMYLMILTIFLIHSIMCMPNYIVHIALTAYFRKKKKKKMRHHLW